MSPDRPNVLVICGDEHTRDLLGCAGNSMVSTPHLDELAAGGTRFSSGYTPYPICGPARAALATGRYAHQLDMWDSASPYDGSVRSWAHRLRDHGYDVASIGKLHFRGGDDNGFAQEIHPMYATDGVGWVRGLLRSEPWILTDVCSTFANDIGPGESTYTEYDRAIASSAVSWLERATDTAEPWALFVSFMAPHFPLIAPDAFFSQYRAGDMPWPVRYGRDNRPDHPVVRAIADALDYGAGFDDERVGQAVAGYYALCSFLDHNIGLVLEALGPAADDTLIVYTSDHGEMLGTSGLWAKSFMYEPSVGVPLIIRGPGVAAETVLDAAVSLVDVYPTVLAAAGIELDEQDADLAGSSLLDITPDTNRTAFSEYHDGGSPTASFMLRTDHWKYVHHVGFEPQLFDLDADPTEALDLADDPGHRAVLDSCERDLRTMVDVDEANERAFADQARRIEAFGGADAVRIWGDFGYTPLEAS